MTQFMAAAAHRLRLILQATSEGTAPPLTRRDGARLIELNGDRLWMPDDLWSYVSHTCVSRPEAAIPQLLAEPNHDLWIREHLRFGDTALDIGANLGLFTCMMARRVKYGLVGWVHAFEPSPRVCQDLCRVLKANRIENVVVHNAAVSNQCGRAAFYDITTANVQREASHLQGLDRGTLLGDVGHNIVEVETVTLDSCIAHHRMAPRLIKIDVEGAEFLVLEGGREFIRKAKPLLVIEIHPDEVGVFDHARLRAFLDECGYSYRHDDKTYYCE